jgi:hypothetical protein
MIVWKVTGNSIGSNDTGAVYCGTQAEAKLAIREYRADCKANNRHFDASKPEKITIRNRDEMCAELNKATGYGGN